VSTSDPSGQIKSVDEEFDVSLPGGTSITPQRPVNREATAAALGQVILDIFSERCLLFRCRFYRGF
jgi:hypothetical protein